MGVEVTKTHYRGQGRSKEMKRGGLRFLSQLEAEVVTDNAFELFAWVIVGRKGLFAGVGVLGPEFWPRVLFEIQQILQYIEEASRIG